MATNPRLFICLRNDYDINDNTAFLSFILNNLILIKKLNESKIWPFQLDYLIGFDWIIHLDYLRLFCLLVQNLNLFFSEREFEEMT